MSDLQQIDTFSIEAEQSLLGGLLIDLDSFDRLADRVSEDDFYGDAHRRIFRHISVLAGASKAVDVLTVMDAAEHAGDLEQIGGLGYLGEIANATPSAANAVRYAAPPIAGVETFVATGFGPFAGDDAAAGEAQERIGVVTVRRHDRRLPARNVPNSERDSD